jgi:hypothetical protein
MADPISAIVGGITSRNQASSAKRAAATATNQQATALQNALDTTKEQYGVAKGYQQPFYDQGMKGNTALNYGLGFGTDNGGNTNVQSGQFLKPFSMADYQEDPGYQFRLSEGQKALDRGASAKRGYLSGAATKGLTRFNQDQASNEYGNAYNRYNQNQQNAYSRLKDLSSSGFSAGNNLTDLASNYGANTANLQIGQGQNLANGTFMRNQANQQMMNANSGLISTGLNAVVGAGMGAMGGGGFSGAGQGFVSGLSGNPFGSYGGGNAYSAFGGNKYNEIDTSQKGMYAPWGTQLR